MKSVWKKQGDGFVPADDEAKKFAARFEDGIHVMADFRKPRNIKHHRLYFALLNKVVENLDFPISVDTFRQVLLVRIGYSDVIRTKKGELELPKSIAFESMDQKSFDDLFQKSIDYICAEVIPGTDHLDLLREVMEMVGNDT